MIWDDEFLKMELETSLIPADDMWDKFDINGIWARDEFEEETMHQYEKQVDEIVTRHDCMWAGACSGNMHIRCLKKVRSKEPVRSQTSNRSLLRTNRVRSNSPSPRPLTPSESEDENCGVHDICDSEPSEVLRVVPPQDATGQTMPQTPYPMQTLAPTTPATSPAFHSDHCYHQNKSTVALDNLGVQTPSDSEEEIDVVSVADREKLTTLPTNPSAKDRQQLQQTVASAIEQQKKPRIRIRKIPVISPEEQTSPEPRGQKRRRSAKSETTQYITYDKRNQHNNMERLRRIDLRESIGNLRKMLPDLWDNERAAKVLVLKEAVKYINSLEYTERKCAREKENLMRKQKELKEKVKKLRLGNAKFRGHISPNYLSAPGQASSTQDKIPRKKRMGSRCEKRRRKAEEFHEEWRLQ